MPSAPRTLYIETYGCQMNVSDSELMSGRLAEDGYTSVEKPDGADVIWSTPAPSATTPNNASSAAWASSSAT